MRILVISDTHGNTDNFDILLEKEERFDFIIHCGDGAFDINYIEDRSRCEVYTVRGNCDMISRASSNIVKEVEEKRVYVEHGVHLSILQDKELMDFAKFNKVDVIMYGHTHIQRIEKLGDVWVVNPGSLSKPRDGFPSYVVMTTDGNGGFTFEGKRL